MTNSFKHQLHIKGMHCSSCEIIIKDSLEELVGVNSVKADYKKGILEFKTDQEVLDVSKVDQVIKKFGYKVVAAGENKFSWPRLLSYFVLFSVLAWLLFKLGWAGSRTQLDSPMAALVLGVIASFSSCLAVVGGVVISLGSIWSINKSKSEQLISHLLFQFGRFITFVILGGVLGLVGSAFSFSISYSAWLMIIVGTLMLMLAFKQLAIKLPWFNFGDNWSNKIEELSGSKHPMMPFIMGGLTFFLPCGFTQAVQLFAISSGSFVVGALTSGLFVIGTMPVLLLLGIGSSKLAKSKKPIFNKVAAIVVGVFSITIINSGLALLGKPLFTKEINNPITTNSTAGSVKNEQGEQVVKMDVDYGGYSPDQIELKVGVPVRWQIMGKQIGGCNSSIVVPDYGVFKQLHSGLNEVTFTPTKTGRINFSCGMGMITGQFNVID